MIRIQSSIKTLHKLGVTQEACAIANRVFGVAAADPPKELTVAGDGFISLIGSETQGYHLVPIY